MWASGARGGGQIWEMLRGGGDGGDGGGEGTAAARMWWRGQTRASRADEGWRCAGDEDEACRWRERAHHKREAGRVPCHPNVGRRPVASHLALELFLGHLRRGRSECGRRKCAALRARRTCGSRLPKYRRCPQPPLVPADMDRYRAGDERNLHGRHAADLSTIGTQRTSRRKVRCVPPLQLGAPCWWPRRPPSFALLARARRLSRPTREWWPRRGRQNAH